MTPTDSSISIESLRLRACIGVSQQERNVGNDFAVDICLHYPAGKAMLTDEIDSAINYASVIRVIRDAIATEMQLLEHAARAIALNIEAAFPQVTSGYVIIHKLQPPVPEELTSASFRLDWVK